MTSSRRTLQRFTPRLALAVALAIGSGVVPARVCFAQSKSADPKSDSARLKKEADALMDQDKYADALALYQKAFELSADPALLYNQGRALEAMGDYPEALDKLEHFEREAPPALQKKATGLKEHLADLRNRITTIVVTTNVAGARLLVREKAAGTLEKETKVRTRSGPATLEVTAEGYESFKTSMELPGGTTVSINAQLTAKKKLPDDALIIVRTKPQADVSLDGKALGRAPLEQRLAPGSYVLTANAQGYEEERVPMTLTLGDRRELDLELKKGGSVFGKWWFWTAIGVVAAGGVATFVLVTTERDPDSGSFRPGSVPGP
jgi:tetratricopeptide (TPR) repeat protein